MAVPATVIREQTRERVRRHRARRSGKAPMGGLFRDAGVLAVPSDDRVTVPSGDPVEWVERCLSVPSGPLTGQPFRLGQWQREFFRGATAEGIREAGLSVARKNGKSGLVAAVVASYLFGPLNRPGWRCLCTSLTGALAAELRTALVDMLVISGIQHDVRLSPPPGAVYGLNGSVCQFLAADKSTGHAAGADLALIDEAGLLPEQKRALWAAMFSSMSGRDGRLMAISIQGDGPMFRELKDRAETSTVFWMGFEADLRDPIDDPATWAKANPGLADGIKSEAYMRDAAARALTSSVEAALFRSYDLNLPVDPGRQTLVTLDQWEGCRGSAEREGWCTLGIDLGGSASMTAAAAYWPRSGRLEVWAAFPGMPNLADRAAADGVGSRYARMFDRGELSVYEGVRTTPVKYFLADVLDALDGERVRCVAADRYRRSEALDVFAAANLRARVSWRGQGWKDAAEDVRAFQRAVINGRLHAAGNLVLESAIVESSLAMDPAGNAKLDKARSVGRIDAASAAVLACGEAERQRLARRRGGRNLGIA